MKKSLKNIALLLTPFIISYLTISFITLSLDFREWTEFTRVSLFIFSIPTLIFVSNFLED